ncbi:hypothetical protein FEK35_30620 [Nocardia cyriacigeorgica]|uniref:Uncharacterized protein n=1 Tax=Nocardia cyriacigeorgica TaxID=135487 RepID=A0A5R8NAN6_9NOCA|nr:hypothetical protein FEK34_28765 [Nocardia cyriacigeorgica]TLF92382.1 hypothetical protein FEK35_30620 [Nocardia cyriacigeorgica]
MSRHSYHPSDADLRPTFDAALTRACAGQGIRTCTGLNAATDHALAAVSAAAPDPPEALVAAARAAFAQQLAGTGSDDELPRFMRQNDRG